MYPLLLHPVRLLDIVVNFVLHEREKKKVSRSPVKLPGQFEVSSPSASCRKRIVVDDPNFASALASECPRGKTRKSG